MAPQIDKFGASEEGGAVVGWWGVRRVVGSQTSADRDRGEGGGVMIQKKKCQTEPVN